MASKEIVKALRTDDPRVEQASLCWLQQTAFDLDGEAYRVRELQVARDVAGEWCVVLGLEPWR
ncbi:MAG: hypothetical protein ACK4X1_10285 [Terricaulis sp.]